MTSMARVQRVGIALALLVAGAVAAGVALAAAKHPNARRPETPSLRLLSETPLTLGGVGFRPGGTVRLTLEGAGARRTLSAPADARGAFRASFGWIALDPCRSGMIVVTARDADGRRATVKRRGRTAHRRPAVRTLP